MDIQQITSDTNYSVRTQISLSPSLYRSIKATAKKEGRSLSAVLRARYIRTLKEEEKQKKQKKETLERLANIAWELPQEPGQGWAAVKNPHALIRKWRKDADENRKRLMQRVSQ